MVRYVARLDGVACRLDPVAIKPDVPGYRERRSSAAGPHHTGVPQPFVDALARCCHGSDLRRRLSLLRDIRGLDDLAPFLDIRCEHLAGTPRGFRRSRCPCRRVAKSAFIASVASTLISAAACSFDTTSGGVLAGANNPIHTTSSTFLMPASAIVWTFGKRFSRSGVSTAMALSFLPSTSGSATDGPATIRSTWPPMTSVTTCDDPLYGNVRHLDAGRLFEQFDRKMRDRPNAAGAERQRLAFLGARLGERDELLDRIGRQIGIDQEGVEATADHARDRHEVVQRIVGQRLVEARR